MRELGREQREEPGQRRVRDRAAHARVELEVDLARREHAVDEPHRRAVAVALELGDREPLARRRARPGAQDRAIRVSCRVATAARRSLRSQPIMAPDARGPFRVVAQLARERAQPLAVARRAAQRPAQVGQAAPAHKAGRLRAEHAHDLGPERRGLERAAVVGRGLAGQIERAPRPRARDREEVPLALGRVGLLDAELGRRGGIEDAPLGAAAGQRPLLEAEHEGDLEPAGAGAAQVEHGDPARLGLGADAHGQTLHGRDHLVASDRAIERADLVDRLQHRPARAHVAARVLGHELGAERPRRPHHVADEGGQPGERILGGGEHGRGRGTRSGPACSAIASIDLVVADHAAPAQAALEVVDAATQHAREGAAQEREQLRPLAAQPGEAQGSQEGDAEARAVERDAAVHRDGHADRGKRRLERGPVRAHRRHDHADLVGAKAGADEAGDLGRDLLGDAAATAGLEQHHPAVRLGGGRRRPVGEERLGQVRQHRRMVMVGRRQLLEAGALRERLDQRPHGCVGGPVDLVRERHGDRAARRERAQRTHLRLGHVLEAVGEHGAGVPRIQAALEQTGGARAPARAVVGPGRVERRAVRGDERLELLRPCRPGDGPRIGHRRRQLVGERADGVLKAAEACRCLERCERRVGDDGREQQPPLHLADERAQLTAAAEHLLEQIVERADAPAHEHPAAAHKLAFDAPRRRAGSARSGTGLHPRLPRPETGQAGGRSCRSWPGRGQAGAASVDSMRGPLSFPGHGGRTDVPGRARSPARAPRGLRRRLPRLPLARAGPSSTGRSTGSTRSPPATTARRCGSSRPTAASGR